MNDLIIGPDWAQQIARLRELITEDTNIMRWGNDFYRCCREGLPITVRLHTPDGTQAVDLRMRPGDLYVTEVAGNMQMGRYSSLLGGSEVSGEALANAVHELAKRKVHGEEAFGMRSLIVFCVAESLRFDGAAREVGYTMLNGQSKVLGTEAPLSLGRWWNMAHDWGQACDAIWASLGEELRDAAVHPRSSLSIDERALWGRPRYDEMPNHLAAVAQATKTLKRPGG